MVLLHAEQHIRLLSTFLFKPEIAETRRQSILKNAHPVSY